MPKTIDDFTNAELAGMVRRSLYLDGAQFGDGDTDCRFLLVLAIPYGHADDVDDLPTAIEAFHSLVSDEDWKEREFQVYDHMATQHLFSASMEEVESNRDGDDQ